MRVEGPRRLGLRSVIGRIEWKLDHARGTERRTGTGYDVSSQDGEASIFDGLSWGRNASNCNLQFILGISSNLLSIPSSIMAAERDG